MKRFLRCCIFGLTVFLLLALTALVYQSTRQIRYETSGKEFAQPDGNAFSEPFKSPDDVLIQYFRPARSHLWFLRMRLALSDETQDITGWSMSIRMFDDRNNLVADATVDESSFSGGRYFELWFDGGVHKGKEYRLELRQTAHGSDERDWTSSFVVYAEPAKLKENRQCTFNGQAQDYRLDLVYYYNFYDNIDLYAAVAVMIVLLVILHRRYMLAKKPMPQILAAALWAISPAYLFFVAEWIAQDALCVEPAYALANLAIYYGCCLFASVSFRKIKWGMIGIGIPVFMLSLGFHFVNELRGSPMMLSDLMSIGTALSVASSYTYHVYMSLALGVECAVAYFVIWGLCDELMWPEGKRGTALRLSGIGLILAAMTALTLYEGELYLPNGILAREENREIEQVDVLELPNAVYISETYQQKGLIWMMYLQARSLRVKEPEGYSLSRVNEIAEAGTQAYLAREEKERITPTNIILIMNESLADFTDLGQIAAQEEILPFMHSLSENTIKGHIQVSVLGGGTSQSEYEALTGNAVSLLPTGSNAYELYCWQPEYGLAWTLKSQGYDTVAMHPSVASNYNRKAVYSVMGFDEFISKENWRGPFDLMGSLISDESAFQSVIDVVEEREGAPVFAFLVTLQNHGGYADNVYEGRVKLDYAEEYPEAEMYLALANESDRAFKRLTEYFAQVEEPTMIVMFGDHFPSIESDLYTRLLGEDSFERQKRYLTPYVIWTNYPMESGEQDMSANYLGSTILQLAGLETTAYDRYLLSLKEKLPIIGHGYVCDAQGNWYLLDDLPQAYETLIGEYRIMEHNRVFDRGSAPALYTIED